MAQRATSRTPRPKSGAPKAHSARPAVRQPRAKPGAAPITTTPPADSRVDVAVLGAHCSAYLAAAVLRHDAPTLTVAHVALPAERHVDRLTLANPRLFELHPVLHPLRDDADWLPACGVSFLADRGTSRGEYRCPKTVALVVPTEAFRQRLARAAAGAGVATVTPASVPGLGRLAEDGVELLVDGKKLVARVVIVAGAWTPECLRAVGLSPGWASGVQHRYRMLRCRVEASAVRLPGDGTASVVPMSLDLAGCGAWAWLMARPVPKTSTIDVQLSVMQPARGAGLEPGADLAAWVENLVGHGVLSRLDCVPDPRKQPSAVVEVELPVAGALSGETVGNRTVLIGPAGGFVAASSEELYPCCWSAVLAAQVIAAALKARHPQDELCDFRRRWGSTVGDYLRGPQQNLKLLLPLVYRNNVMAARVAEAILSGDSVVR